MESTVILIGVILLLASFAQGLTGFGFALISIPLLSLLIDVKHAVPLGALCGLVINIYLAVELNEHIKYLELKNLILGAVIGIPIGVIFLTQANTDLIKDILGVVILVFVLFSITNVFKRSGLNRRWGYLFGFLSGIFGGAFNTNGPPILVYFYLQGWDKNKQKASITGFFIITTIIIVSSHFISGLTTVGVLKDFIIYLPFILIGLIAGSRLFKKVSTEIFQKIIMVGLLAISILLIFG